MPKSIKFDPPKVTSVTTTIKQVTLELGSEQVCEIVREWLITNVPQFRNMPEIRVDSTETQGLFSGVYCSARRETTS